MSCGMSIRTSASTSSRSRLTWSVSRSFDAPGTSICNVIPSSSSKISVAGRSTSSGRRPSRCSASGWRVATSLVSAMSFSSVVLVELDRARLRRFLALDRDLQHAVPVTRLDPIGIPVLGERDDAAEITGEALAAVVGHRLVRRQLPFAGHGKQVLLHRKLDLLRIEASSEEVDLEVVGRRAHVNRGESSPRDRANARRRRPLVEEIVDLLLQAPKVLEQAALEPGKTAKHSGVLLELGCLAEGKMWTRERTFKPWSTAPAGAPHSATKTAIMSEPAVFQAPKNRAPNGYPALNRRMTAALSPRRSISSRMKSICCGANTRGKPHGSGLRRARECSSLCLLACLIRPCRPDAYITGGFTNASAVRFFN